MNPEKDEGGGEGEGGEENSLRIDAEIGSDLILNCSNGKNIFNNLTWLENDFPVENDLESREKISGGDLLKLKNVILNDSGNYTCIVCDTNDDCVRKTFVVNVVDGKS